MSTRAAGKRFGYREIEAVLRERISTGVYQPGSPLPSEEHLAAEFSVTRTTVGRACASLEADGAVVTLRGRGRFIADPEGVERVEHAYAHIVAELRRRIADGSLAVGDRLPSEAAVCREFEVTRDTVRHALAVLEREGLARSAGGGVRVVTEPIQLGDDGDRSTAWVVHSERSIYENYWVTVSMADIQTPDGERFEHHKVNLPPAAVVAMVDEHERVFMMWRHRFVPDTWGWELPGGVVGLDEGPEQTARREIVEEAGYRLTGELEHVASFQPMAGTVDSPHDVYVAHGVEYVGEPTELNESQRTAWIPLDKLPELISQHLISSAGTLIGVLHLIAELQRRPS